MPKKTLFYLYFIIACYIAWIWIDYFRMIDLFEKEKLHLLIITFFLGCLSVYFVFGIKELKGDYKILEPSSIWYETLLHCIFRIGLIEELAKLIPFAIMMIFARKEINEPLDFIVFAGIGALGFSATENALYFTERGARLIDGRSILATVGHLIDSAIIAYGFILNRYFYRKKKWFRIPLFILIAAFVHGFYDFWLLHKPFASFGLYITITFFLFCISIYAVIMNNALNNTRYFLHHHTINFHKIWQRLFRYYGILFFIQFLIIGFQLGFEISFYAMYRSITFSGLIILFTVVRLSQFKLEKYVWRKIPIELPFKVVYVGFNSWFPFRIAFRD